MDKKCKLFKTILILFLVVSPFISAQEIKINLQIEWKKSTNNLKCYNLDTKNSILIPYLKITYKNNSNKSYYFKNIMYNNKNYAPIGIRLASSQINYNCNKLAFKKEEEKNYIILGNNELTNEFVLYSDTVKKTLSSSNVSFSNIRGLFQTQNKLDILETKKKLKCFKFPNKKTINQKQINTYLFKFKDSIDEINNNDISKENILNKLKKYFIFLKPYEVKEYEVNLIAVLIIGGNYNFSIQKKVFSDEISIKNLEKGKIIYQKINLPLTIEEYCLYTGKLSSNNVDLNIKYNPDGAETPALRSVP